MKKTILLTLIGIATHGQAQNVGINTSSPKNTLDVKGGIRNQALYMVGSGTSIVIPDNQSNINLAGTFAGQFSATINIPEDGQKLTIDNVSNETGVLSGTVDIRKGLNEYTFSDGEWKALNTNAWGLSGNQNTDANNNFIGTTDKTDVVFKRFNTEKLRLNENDVQITGSANVAGNINVTGTIQANGVDGTANQVLAKNTSNNLAWVNTAHANNVRFRGRFRDETSSTTGTIPILELVSILNTSAVSVGSNSFLINKSGLYHFDIDLSISTPTAANPTFRPFANLNFNLNTYGLPLNVGNFEPFNLVDNSLWLLRGSKSFEVHVEAPASLNISYTISAVTGTKSLNCYVYGHLVSE
jgi:hypothetical protein